MQVAVRILFGLVFLTLVVLAHVYLFRRLVLASAPARWAVPLRRVLLGWLALLVGGTVFIRVQGIESRVWSLLLPIWFGLVLNLLMVVVGVDLFRWVKARVAPPAPVSEERRRFLARTVAASSVVAGAGLTGFGAFRAYEPAHITELPVRLPHWPRALEGFTIVQLTDIHIGPVLKTRFLDDLVDRANGQRPDLMAITGDLVDGSVESLGGIVGRLGRLQSRFGTYFVTGNHDYYSGADEWVRALRGLGVQVIRNRRVQVGDAAASFDLLGVDDWGHGGDSGDYDLESAVAGRDPERPSILLAHQPANFDVVARQGIGLQLSGHTHGGQLFPSTLAASLIWRERVSGLSKVGDSSLYVSRGCGFVGPPARNGSPPEIVKVVLLAG